MIKLIVLDVDGTLTDGKITYDNEGNELKSFNVKDGLGIAAWIKLGKKAAIITGRKSQIVENRAKELGITYIKQGISNKANALYEILDQSQIHIDEVAIIGDDLNDLSMFKIAKYTFAPKDSAKEIQRKYACEDTAASIEIASKANVTNPAIMIFLVDIMNQYGQGISKTISAAASCSNGSGSILEQLAAFREWCSNNISTYNTYLSRRNKTYAYIESLEKAGKFAVTHSDISTSANSVGTLNWPTPTCTRITSPYGPRKHPKTGKNSFHTGVDLAKNGGANGEPIYAAHSGTISTKDYGGRSYGTLTMISNGNMTTYYAHQSSRASGIRDGVTVERGQLIGYVGSTGNSTGPHLHFEVRINGQTQDPQQYIKWKG